MPNPLAKLDLSRPIEVLDGLSWATARYRCRRCGWQWVEVYPIGVVTATECPGCGAVCHLGWREQHGPCRDVEVN